MKAVYLVVMKADQTAGLRVLMTADSKDDSKADQKADQKVETTVVMRAVMKAEMTADPMVVLMVEKKAV